MPNSVSNTIQPWLIVTAAVVMTGSSTVRFACGTNFNTRAFAGCAMATRGNAAAAPAASPARTKVRRFMKPPADYYPEACRVLHPAASNGWPIDEPALRLTHAPARTEVSYLM